MKSDIRCTTPRCVNDIANYGERYHEVHTDRVTPAFMPDAVAQCTRCGGYTNGTDWKHVCKHCGKEVKQGELVGLFVPHSCPECQQAIVAKQKASGSICRGCGQSFANCCC